MKLKLFAVLVLVAVCCNCATDAFCGNRTLEVELVRLAVKSGEWLKLQQDKIGGFGAGHESAQVFQALGLLGFSISDSGVTHLKSEINRPGIESVPVPHLAHYVHGILATCEKPTKFYNHNLINHLKKGLNDFPMRRSPRFETNFEYSLVVLALCSSGHIVNERFAQYLIKKLKLLKRKGKFEIKKHPFDADSTAMATIALSCVNKHQVNSKNRDYKKQLHVAIKRGIHYLLLQQNDDGSFGNEITTALAAQAMLAANHKTKKWQCAKTMRSIIDRKDHWFRKNVMSTVQIVPALVGALPFDINSIDCPETGPRPAAENVKACVKLAFDGNDMTKGKTLPPVVTMMVPKNTNAHSLLKKAANAHPCYQFSTKKSKYGHMITEVCGIKNNQEEKYYWMIYSSELTMAPHGVDDYYPPNGTCVIFKYQKLRGPTQPLSVN